MSLGLPACCRRAALLLLLLLPLLLAALPLSAQAAAAATPAPPASAPTPSQPSLPRALGPTTTTAPNTPSPKKIRAVAFGGSGFLAIFQAAVLDELRLLGLVDRFTPTAGASGGTIIAGASCLGLSHEQTRRVAATIMNHCRTRNSCAGRLDAAVRATARLAVEDAFASALARNETDALVSNGSLGNFVRLRCLGRGAAYVTRLLVDPLPPPDSGDKQEEEDDDAFISSSAAAAVAAVAATAGKQADTKNTTTADTDNNTNNITIAKSPRNRGHISLGRFSRSEAWRVADFSSAEDFVAAGAASAYVPHFSGPRGYTVFRGQPAIDGAFWHMMPPCRAFFFSEKEANSTAAAAAAGGPYPGCLRVSAVVSGMPVVPGMPLPDADSEISPGKFLPLPLNLTAEQWGAYVLTVPPNDEVSAAIEQHGRASALAWAKAAFGV